MTISGTALATLGVGTVFLYSGVKGVSPLLVVQKLVKGQTPATVAPRAATGAVASSVTGEANSPAAVASGGSVQAIFQATATQYGWGSGSEWQALQNIEMNEAGYNPNAVNPSSGALGLAQALGHGNANTAGTLGNEYGGYGLTDAQAQQANSGDPATQALWMMGYIQSRYGDPATAWAQYHHADGTNWY